MADAVGLLAAVIGGRVAAEPGAARVLAGRCARLPLALRVAAELAVAQPALSLAGLAADLAGEQTRLDLLDAGGDPRTAVRAVFSWSRRHLDDTAAQGFALLGLHPGPDLEPYAAAALAGVTLPQARQLLGVLARAHLVQPSPAGPGRYVLHDLLRAYARDLAAGLAEGQPRAALTRLLDHYLHTATVAVGALHSLETRLPALPPTAGPVPPVTEATAARAWMDTELACLIAGAGHAAAHGWPRHATSLAGALFRPLCTLGRYPQANTICGYALSAARVLRDRGAEAGALADLGAIEMASQDHFEQAAEHLQQALSLARETGDQVIAGRALNNLGQVRFGQSRYADAVDASAQALALAREMGDQAGQARSLGNLGSIEAQRGRHDEAIGYLRQALAIAVESGNRIRQAETLTELGMSQTALGHHQQAARDLGQALSLARSLDYRNGVACALGALGVVQGARGRYGPAVRLLTRAITAEHEVGHVVNEAELLNHLGRVLLAAGQPGQARSQFTAALSLAAQFGGQHEQARALDGLAACCDTAGDHGQARDHWQQALAIFTSIGSAEADRVRAQLAAQPAPQTRTPDAGDCA